MDRNNYVNICPRNVVGIENGNNAIISFKWLTLIWRDILKMPRFFYLLKEDDNDNIIIKMVTHIYSGVSLQKRLAQFD